MGDFLVLVAVRDLKQDDYVVDEYGPRRVTVVKRYKDSAYLTFSEGPSNFYHDSELMPTERLS